MSNNIFAQLSEQATSQDNVSRSNNTFQPMFLYKGTDLKAIIDALNGTIKPNIYEKKRSEENLKRYAEEGRDVSNIGKRLIVSTMVERKMPNGKTIPLENVATVDISSKIEDDPEYVMNNLDKFYVGQTMDVDPRFDLINGAEFFRLVGLTIITFQEAEEQKTKSGK